MNMIMRKKAIQHIERTKSYFNLQTPDKTELVSSISDGVFIRENNFWFLVCAAIVASVGLDINSPVIIIAALLITPIAGPMLGTGLSYATFSRELMFTSLKNFAAAIAVILVLSTLYFIISPSMLPTAAILLRAEPNLSDILIAFFGGVAAVIAASSRGPVHVFPSAALAAVLMLPLCAVGYGIASSDVNIIKGAASNFFINMMIVSLAVFLIVRYINVPYKKYQDHTMKIRSKVAVAVVLFILTIPAALIAYDIIIEEADRDKAREFINNHLEQPGVDVVTWNIHSESNDKVLTIYVDSDKGDMQDTLRKLLVNYLQDTRLDIVPVEAGGFGGRFEEGTRLDVMRETDMLLQRRLDSLSRVRPTMIGSTPGGMEILVSDLRMMFPNLDTIRISHKGPENTPGIAILWKARRTENVLNENRIVEYVKQKMGFGSLVLLRGIYIDSIPSRKINPVPPKPEVKKPKR